MAWPSGCGETGWSGLLTLVVTARNVNASPAARILVDLV